MTFQVQVASAGNLRDYLTPAAIKQSIKNNIADLDISFSADLANIEVLKGIHVAMKYNYDVQSSYINKFYTRIDKWDVNLGVNVGDTLKTLVDVPFSFSINRSNSFFFVRQFKSKKEALISLPYTPAKLPLNAKLASRLKTGEFVSMPANLNVAVGVDLSTSTVGSVGIKGEAKGFYIVSGEYTVQVFKIDESHVRLKLITKSGTSAGGSVGAKISFNLLGLNILNQQIDNLIDQDLVQLKKSIDPSSQFIVDYIFDLNSPEACEAYNQILSSTFKFKDIIVLDHLLNAHQLKDKVISSYEKADELFHQDINVEPKARRVQRIFKGFNNDKAKTNHLKLAFIETSLIKDKIFTESRLTFIDKDEQDIQFYYPTFSKYVETNLGSGVIGLKDQTFQNNFALIPTIENENNHKKDPDIGLSFERKDRYFTRRAQRRVLNFIFGQIPPELLQGVDFSQWQDDTHKLDSRINFQLILKAQSFQYLRQIPLETLIQEMLKYTEKTKKLNDSSAIEDETRWQKIKGNLRIGRFIKKEQIIHLAESLNAILNDEKQTTEMMSKKIIMLTEKGIFDQFGVGFLMSLLPKEKLADLSYLKLEMIGKNLKALSIEKGNSNYRALYKELNEVQSRLSNRSYDLRVSEADQNMEDLDIDKVDSFDNLN